jgi:hypothetical protein
MKNDQKPVDRLEVTIKRIRTRISGSVRTGEGVSANCFMRSDPTDGPECKQPSLRSWCC